MATTINYALYIVKQKYKVDKYSQMGSCSKQIWVVLVDN